MVIDISHSCYLMKSYELLLSSSDFKKSRKSIAKGKLAPYKHSMTKKKIKNRSLQLPSNSIRFVHAQKSFLEMIARTIDKTRKEDSSIDKESHENVFSKSKEIETIDDLIDEVESTRPRIWSRDSRALNGSFMKMMPSRSSFVSDKPKFPCSDLRGKILLYSSDAKKRKERKPDSKSFPKLSFS